MEFRYSNEQGPCHQEDATHTRIMFDRSDDLIFSLYVESLRKPKTEDDSGQFQASWTEVDGFKVINVAGKVTRSQITELQIAAIEQADKLKLTGRENRKDDNWVSSDYL